MRYKLLTVTMLLLLTGGGALRAQAVVSVDPSAVRGAVKPMNAGNNGPTDMTMESYKALRVPYARTHDTPLGMAYGGHCIDINQVFPDFSANVNSPKSYDFTNSDVVLLDMQKAGTKPFYRLGQSIEHQTKKYGIYPPKDYLKWAKICEHIIRHYNEGWADGYKMGIEYWEIWNEPDLDQPDDRWKTDPRTWAGTMEQFDELYVVTAKHLKKCFPDLKIGGPAFANPRKYGPDFLDYVKDKGAPLDFFSHHMYHRKPARIVEDVRIIRKMLDDKGFTGTESILNEWNYNRSWDEPDRYSRRVRPTVKAAAFVAAVMCECQKAPLDMLMYYDLRPNTSWCGPWTPVIYDIRPPYWALYYWAELASYGTQIESVCDTGNIYTCAARSEDGSRIRLLVSRYHEDDAHNTPREVSVTLPDGWSVVSARITDSEGQDRKAEPAVTYTMESNSVILFELNNCHFENNHATRGGAISSWGCTGSGIYLNGCSFSGNWCSYKFGTTIFVSRTQRFCMNNCSFNDNTYSLSTDGDNACWVYVDGNAASGDASPNNTKVLDECVISNCSIIGSARASSSLTPLTNGQELVYILDLKSGGKCAMINNAIIAEGTEQYSWWFNATNISGYNNVCTQAGSSCTSSCTYTPSGDTSGKSKSDFGSLAWDATDNVWKWNGTLAGGCTAISASDFATALGSGSSSFKAWLEEKGALNKDQLGNDRGTGAWWPGAYQAN